MNLGAILKDALQVFGLKDVASAPQAALDRALIDINATLQQLEDAGEDFFTREELQVTLSTDTETYTLPKNIQTVLEPAKLDDGTLLRELTSRGQLNQFGQVFLGQTSNVVTSAKPSAYFVESLRDAADTTGDNVAIVVHVLPKPSIAVATANKLVLNVIKEPAQFVAADLTTGTAILELPHKYVESIFLPMMRHNLTRSYLFWDKDKLEGIEADYREALRLLDKGDPRRPNPEESNTQALEEAGKR
jgi:hypothetical protein